MVADEQRDISKLPKWAQQRILGLQRTVQRQENLIGELEKELTAGATDAAVTYSNGYLTDDRPLPDRARVEFTMKNAKGGKTKIRVYLGEDIHGVSYLDLNADRGVRIYPRASNSIYIEPGD